jgi:23S rRNA-/tRNA-specific pseudouridylate synthase/2-polyprenyl-3-methyl-5-hydroxy-6-metoxy-1,4-benzoquinol methylase
MEILHIDDDLVVIVKPAGMAMGGGSGGRRPGKPGVIEKLGRAIGDRGRPAGLWAVHDMDREASGLLVLARHPRAAADLRDAFKNAARARIYVAVIRLTGDDAPDPETTSVHSLLRPNRRGVADVIAPGAELAGDDSEDAMHDAYTVRAVTHLQPRERNGRLALVRVRAETDHPYQVRAHLESRGTPVLGDRPYGGQAPGVHRLFLHADELGFDHPRDGKPMRFRVRAPEAFTSIVRTPPDFDALEEQERLSTAVEQRAEHDAPTDTPSNEVDAPRPVPQSPGRPALIPEATGDEPESPAQHERVEPPRSPERSDPNATGWDHVADWYADHLASADSDLQVEVVRPGVRALLETAPDGTPIGLDGRRVLDVACGEGALSRELAGAGAEVVGVDVSERLIDVARDRSGSGSVSDRLSYLRGDARALPSDERVSGQSFDAAVCVLALMNIDDLDAVCRGVADRLVPGGVFVSVVIHPAFRSPGVTSWEWTEAASGPVQYRRVDRYLAAREHRIVMNPGEVARGEAPVETTTFTRPVSAYVNALADAGLVVDRMDEWVSPRRSQPGPRADAENTARAEIPMFLAIRARRPQS